VEAFQDDKAGGPKLVDVGDPVSVSEGIGMAFRLEDTALRDEFNTALQELKADGTWRALSDKWGIAVYE